MACPHRRRLVNSNNFPAYTTFASITFTGDNYDISGNPVTITAGISAGTGAAGNLFRPHIRLGSATAGISAGGASSQLTIAGDIDLNDYNLRLFGAGELHCSGIISGRAGVLKQGSGHVYFDGIRANTYGGDTTVEAGILELSRYILINPGGIRSPRIAVPGNFS